MLVGCRRRVLEANALTGAAAAYWLEVFPFVKRELERWRLSAAGIPDRGLARLALDTQACERGNLEGSAVFALLAPRARRAEVIRAAIAFQALYDFLDTLAELPVANQVANGRSLHLALLAALDPDRPPEPYFEHSGFAAGGSGFAAGGSGYVEELICACRRSLAALPRYDTVAGLAREAATRMVAYQSFNHDARDPDRRAMRRWGLSLAPPGSRLEWWEAAAGAASSLGVFALIAAAATPELDAAEAHAAAEAYFPWAGALHVLLDSLVDLELDLLGDDHSLLAHYPTPARAAERLGAIAEQASWRLAALGQGERHALILTAMASFYLSRPAARAPATSPATRRVLGALGPSTRPAMALLRARAALAG